MARFPIFPIRRSPSSTSHSCLSSSRPPARHPTASVFVLGLAFAGLTFLVKAPVGLIFAGALSAWLRARPSVLTWVYRSSGALLVGLGVRLALERR